MLDNVHGWPGANPRAAILNRPTILYLDQNAWIALARGSWDKTAHPAEHAALTVVCEALQAEQIIVPLSFTNIYETLKIDIPERRAHLAHVMVTISGGKVLRGRQRILELMLLGLLSETARSPEPDLSDDWFLSDLWFECVAERDSGHFDGMLSPEVIAATRAHSQEALFTFLVGSDEVVRKEAVRRFTAESEALQARIAARRLLTAGETFALRLRAYAASLLLDELDYILSIGRRCGLAWKTTSDIGATLAKRLIADVPILEAERQLAVRLEDQPRVTTDNDQRDMAAFAAALPLADMLVAERQFVNLSRQARLDRRYGTQLLTSVNDLTPELLSARESGVPPGPGTQVV